MAYNQMQRGSGGPHHGGGGALGLERLLVPDSKIEYFATVTKSGQRPILRAQLLDDDARAVAKAISALPASQLRRFYSAVITLKRELEIDSDGTSDELVRARLALFKAHAAYAKKRMKDMPDAFIQFIVRHVASVKTKEDFLYGFAPCFEAVIAYHKLFETKQRGD